MKPFAHNEKRRVFRSNHIDRPIGIALADIHMAGIDADQFTQATNVVFSKLVRALHYRHSGQILPANCGMFVRWFLNPHFHLLEQYKQLILALDSAPLLMRNQRPIGEQFWYRYAMTEDCLESAFLLRFRNIVVVAMASVDLATLDPEQHKH